MKDMGGKKNDTPWMRAKATRPQTVEDARGYYDGGSRAGRFTPGTSPVGGFQGIWAFNDQDCSNSPTSKPEPQNRIIKDGK